LLATGSMLTFVAMMKSNTLLWQDDDNTVVEMFPLLVNGRSACDTDDPTYHARSDINHRRRATPPADSSGDWNTFHIHTGNENHLIDPIPDEYHISGSFRHTNGTQWFSQHSQDTTVARLFNFQRNLYYIDFAANDAVWASNTFALERNLQWTGLCIEPNPFYWRRLAFRRCTLVGAIGGGKDVEEMNFTMELSKGAGPTGGIVGPEFGNKRTQKFEPRYTVSLLTLLKRFEAPTVIDYLSMDVEGAEGFILKPFFERAAAEYTIRTMSIERPSEELIATLEQHSFRKLLDFRRGDTLWVHTSFEDEAKKNLANNPDDFSKMKEAIAKHAMF
jgi:Methyltransferase FkbM domain